MNRSLQSTDPGSYSCCSRGGDLGGTAHILVPPIFLEVVLSDVRESMNRVKNCVFLVRKWSYTIFNIVNIRKMWEKKGKIRRTRSKKGSSEIFTLKMEIFPEIGPRKNLLVPPQIR